MLSAAAAENEVAGAGGACGVDGSLDPGLDAGADPSSASDS